MLLSLELLLPDRYPESLISSKPFTETSTSSSGSSLSPELEQAAQEVRGQAKLPALSVVC
jgi:hypothetical protein